MILVGVWNSFMGRNFQALDQYLRKQAIEC
jgi:hypothetical protein